MLLGERDWILIFRGLDNTASSEVGSFVSPETVGIEASIEPDVTNNRPVFVKLDCSLPTIIGGLTITDGKSDRVISVTISYENGHSDLATIDGKIDHRRMISLTLASFVALRNFNLSSDTHQRGFRL